VRQGFASGEHVREADVRQIIPRREAPGPRRPSYPQDPAPDIPRRKPTGSSNCFAERSRDRGVVVLSKKALVHVNRRNIGDFVLCQGESGSGASLGACDGSGALSRVRPVAPVDV